MYRLATLLLLLITQVCWASEKDSKQINGMIQIEKVKIGDLNTEMIIYGKIIAPVNEIKSINFTRDINIDKIFLNPGRVVSAGEDIMQITTSKQNFEAYKQLQANLKFAEKELSRIEVMFKQKMATLAELNLAKKNLENAQHQLKAQELLGYNIHQEVIKSPYDALITEILFNPGEYIKSGTTIIKLLPLDQLIAQFSVNSVDVENIHIGQLAIISSAVNHNHKTTGKIQEIDAIINPDTNLIGVIVNLDQKENFIIGMKIIGKVNITYKNQILVPKDAVMFQKGQNYIYLLENGAAKKVLVKVAAENEQDVAVVADIKPEQLVITKGCYQLTDGMKVKVH